MEEKYVKFITSEPALYLPKLKALVIADLHLGFEHELWKNGIKIPAQAPRMKKKIKKLSEQCRAEKLIIVGDLKHKVPGISSREYSQIPRLFYGLELDVIIARGNHDSGLEKLVDFEISKASGFKLGRYGFFHGHSWPSKKLLSCQLLLCAHSHPSIAFKDEFGLRMQEPVWLRGKLSSKKVKEKWRFERKPKLVLLPAFNELLQGTALNKEEALGPLFANSFVEQESLHVWLLDGTKLGKLSSISSRHEEQL